MPITKSLKASLSLKALARASAFPVVVRAASVLAAPAAAQNACTNLTGGLINCTAPVAPPAGSAPGTPAITGTLDVAGSLDPLVVTLENGFVSQGSFNLSTLGGADISIISNGVSTIETLGSGLVLNSSGAIAANVTNVSTVADGATAVLLRAADSVIFASDGLISTVGDNADGVNITGSNVNVDLNLLRTGGFNAQGVEILSTNGPINVNFDAIETNGDLSSATVLRGTGDIALSGRALSTRGTDAAAFDISTNVAACILLGAGGCDVTAALERVTTEGFGGIGGLVAAAGDTNIDIGLLRTGGDEAAGLDLSADPQACIVLGVGACDTAFTVGELTTAGNRSPGALVRAVGDIDADVGVLRTAGDEAVGLDLASNPEACAVLGAGACDTSFSVGELTTSGAGATGILVRAAGETTGSVGVLRTAGDEAAGIDIAADPSACVLIGAGACDVGLVADEVTTRGDGAAAVLINTVGNVTTDLGLIRTGGDNSTGLGITLNPAVCLVLGSGSCIVRAAADNVETGGNNSAGVVVDGGAGAITVDVGDVDTGGNVSPGVDVGGTGPINVNVGNVDTGGGNSPGVIVDGGSGPVIVNCASVTTLGAASPGIALSAEGDIRLRCGAITTRGPDSDAVLIDGGTGTVDVGVGAIVTTGPGSNGIDIATTEGDQVITAGPINIAGAGSNGISAVATGCGDLSITARDDISSAEGTGIFASTGCSIVATTLPGADVSGRTAGIDLTSGTGTTLTLGGNVSSGVGPAIDVSGGSANVTIGATGSVTGRVDLTDNADRLTNNGRFTPVGNSAFGLGLDLMVNAGIVRVGATPALAGLESFVNRGLIDMVDGTPGNRLTTSGDFTGEGGRVAIDVAAGLIGTPADRLIVGGNAGGTTAVTLNLIGGAPAVANPTGTVIVDAGTATGKPFNLEGLPSSGFIDFSLRQSGGDTLLVALPNQFAVEPLLMGRVGQDFWYQ